MATRSILPIRNWLLGGQRRHRGSLHQDVWKTQPPTWPAEDSSRSIRPPGGGGHGLRWSAMPCLRDTASWSRSRRRRRMWTFTQPWLRRSLWPTPLPWGHKARSGVPPSGSRLRPALRAESRPSGFDPRRPGCALRLPDTGVWVAWGGLAVPFHRITACSPCKGCAPMALAVLAAVCDP